MTFAAAIRAAAVDLLTDYAASASIKLQVYRARPSSIYAPCAFVDGIPERIAYTGLTMRRREPSCQVVVLHGKFDDGETVDQRDAFVDGFLDYVTQRYHEAGANTMLAITALDDEPAYVPDWLPPERRVTFYATVFVLEGLVLDGTTVLP